MARKYELRKRADEMDETRRRITQAAVDLHGSVGPARTTVTAVAERAGVQRHTVYRHFPTDADLFAACSAHFGHQFPWPDTAVWSRIADPHERLSTGLSELYDWYSQTGHMWTRVLRDRHLVEAVDDTVQPFNDYVERAARVLAAGWGARGRRKRLLDVAIRHAVDFGTWHSLVGSGELKRDEGVALMARLAGS
jgi:AcrR family transcriptional regulator